MLTQSLGNFTSEEAKKIQVRIQGTTFYNFEVTCTPIGGCVEVVVQSNRKNSHADFIGMLLYVMACEMIDQD